MWLKVDNGDNLQFKWWDHSQYELPIVIKKNGGLDCFRIYIY
jgi:hypothetical protein